MKLNIMFSFWVNDKYITVLSKNYKTAKSKAKKKYKALYE